MKQFILLLACLASTACSHAQPEAGSQASAREHLLRLTQDRTCTSNQQCRTVPMGAKPCGGPQGYMAYSIATADPAKVADLAERYRQEKEAANARSGMASDCRAVTDPGAVCRSGSCQLGRDAGI